MSIINGVRDYLIQCPLFENIPVSVDFLPASGNEAAIEPVPIPKTVKTYTDGSSVCSYQFMVTLRFPWFADDDNGLNCSKWFEDLGEWLETSANRRFLPKMPDGMIPIKIEAVPNRFGFDGKNSLTRYQLICNLTFFKDMKG